LAQHIVLHLGLHKTASSSFQATCAASRHALAQCGFHYPNFQAQGRSFEGNHSVPLFSAFCTDPNSYHMNASRNEKQIAIDNQGYVQQLREALLGHSHVLLSAEDVSDLKEHEMKRLRMFLQARSRQLSVLALVRSPYALHCSAFAAMVVHGGRRLSPSRLLSQRGKIQKVQNVFRELIQWAPFHEAAQHPCGPTAFLLKQAGLSDPLPQLNSLVANTGPDNRQTRLQMEHNHLQQKLLGNQLNPNWQQIPAQGGDKFKLTEQELSELKPDLDKENQFILNNLGATFCDSQFETI
jgi:hypothetical protein